MLKRGRGRPRKIPSDNQSSPGSGGVFNSDKLPEFFTIYVPSLHSEKLKIPPAFIKNFDGNVPIVISIRDSSGMSWEVATVKINENWYFQKGWPEFVREKSLEAADFLTFCYAGDSKFSVKVFALNSCRKEFENGSSNNDGTIKILSDDEASEPEEEAEHGPKKLSMRSSGKRKSHSEYPSFTLTLKKYCINKTQLNIPQDFATAYVESDVCGSRMVTLWIGENSWPVVLLKQSDRHIFSRGWRQFVRDNSLKIGHSCTFKLVDDRNDFVFEVTINR